MDKVCVKAQISGRVQGVSFRAYTQAEARRLGLTGHANNLPDGSVEVLACGDRTAVERLLAWLHTGSPNSKVAAVVTELLPWQTVSDFTTG